MEPRSPGQRLSLIRLACGDGIARPESMREFVQRVRKVSGAVYDHSTVSMLERDKQEWRRKDAIAFASADPLRRGEAWLMFGDASEATADGERVADPAPRKRHEAVQPTKRRRGAR